MMNFWEYLQYKWWRIQATFSPSKQARLDARSHAESLYAVTHPTNEVDRTINETVNSYDIKHVGALGVLSTIGGSFTNIFKKLPLYITILLVIVALYFVTPFIRKSK